MKKYYPDNTGMEAGKAAAKDDDDFIELEIAGHTFEVKKIKKVTEALVGSIVAVVHGSRYELGIIQEVDMFDYRLPFKVSLVAPIKPEDRHASWWEPGGLHMIKGGVEYLRNTIPEFFI